MARDGLRRLLLSAVFLLLLGSGWAQPEKLVQATELVNQGFALMYQGTPETDQQALQKWRQALALCEELNNLQAQHDVWMAIAVLHYSRVRPEEAGAAYQKALELAQAADDLDRQALALKSLGDVKIQQGDYEGAGALYGRALETKRLPDVLFSVARLYSKQGKTEEAIGLYLESLDSLPEARQPITLNMLGGLYLKTGETKKAIAQYERALSIQKKLEDRMGQIITLSSLGELELGLGNLDRAAEYYEQGLSLGPNPEQLYTLHTGMSILELKRSSMAASLLHGEQALKAAHASASEALIARAHINIASSLNTAGRNQEALEHLKKAENAPTPELRIQALRRLAAVERDLGELNSASSHMDRALEIAQSQGMKDLVGPLHLSKANLYSRQGHFLPALEQLEAASTVAREAGDQRALVEARLASFYLLTEWLKADFFTGRDYIRGTRASLITASEICHQIGDNSTGLEVLLAQARLEFEAALQDPEGTQIDEKLMDQAEELARRALTEAKALGLTPGARSARHLLGQIALHRGDTDAAVRIFQAEVEIVLEEGTPLELGSALSNLGTALQARKDFDEAFRIHQREYQLLSELGDLEGMAQASHRLAQVEFFRGDLDAAIRYEDRAIETLESMRRMLSDEVERVNFYQMNHRFYSHQIFYRLLRLNERPDIKQFEDVFSVMESWRARSLLEFLTEDASSPGQQGVNRGIASTLNLRELQRLLDEESILIMYGSSSYNIAYMTVTWDEIRTYDAMASYDQVLDTLRDWQRAIRRRDSGEKQAALLGQLLLPDLTGYRRLIVVADGVTESIPFSALSQNGKPLVETHEVVSLPSCSILAYARRRQVGREASRGVAVIADPVFQPGDPRFSKSPSPDALLALGEFEKLSLSRAGARNFERLPATRSEAERLIALFGSDQVTAVMGFEANRQRVLNELEQENRQIIHYATHGIASTTDPGVSSLVLSLFDPEGQPIDGFIRLNDIKKMKLNADLVVLSACETAVGRVVEDEGVLGLARAFIYAGAPRLLVSQWSVDDEATAALMASFYEGLVEDRLGPGEALRRAQLEVASQKKWAAPYYWAAFQLIGDWEKFEINR